MPKQFRYEQGKLYVRTVGNFKKKFEYEKPGAAPFEPNSLAEIWNERGESYPGGWTETMREAEGTNGIGEKIVRRLATDEDLKGLFGCWGDSNLMVADWIERVVSRSKLSQEEKDRIRRVWEDYGKSCTKKYRVDCNAYQLPTVSTICIQASDEIRKDSVFALHVRHILFYEGHSLRKGFMPAVVSSGSGMNGNTYAGEDEAAYNRALAEGLEMLKKSVAEFETLV